MHQDIADELIRRSKVDQKMRNDVMNEKVSWDHTIDADNTKYLKKVISQIGWPTNSAVGKEAAKAAWLLAQHADHEPEIQEECLRLMKGLPDNEVAPIDIAYLEDRVRVAKGQPQLYGTQFYQKGEFYGPQPIEDIQNLDKRRKEIGLEPFRDYEVRMQRFRR